MPPVCGKCEKTRDDKECRNRIEACITEHAEAEFSHGICPDCAKQPYSERLYG